MNVWLRIMLGSGIIFTVGFIGWYIYSQRQRNARKENLLASLRFALITTVLFTLITEGIFAGLERIFGR